MSHTYEEGSNGYMGILFCKECEQPRRHANHAPEMICMGCDGCGWCEGSPAFTCPDCNGTGLVPMLVQPSQDCPSQEK